MKALFVFLMVVGMGMCNGLAAQKVQWYTLEEAEKQVKDQPEKPIFIDVYTTWCTWCKVMDKKTFTQPKVAEYLNQNFTPVHWDAQTKQDIHFFDKDYSFNGYYNDLSMVLLRDHLEFPALVIVNKYGLVDRISFGYLTEDEFLDWLEDYKNAN